MGPQEMGPRMTLTSCRKQFISIQLKVPADLQLDKIVFRANGIEKKKKRHCTSYMYMWPEKSVHTCLKVQFFLFGNKQVLELETTYMT